MTSLLLVLVMSLALAVPCFAAEPDDPANMGRVVEEWETGGFKFQLIEHDKDDVFVKPAGTC